MKIHVEMESQKATKQGRNNNTILAHQPYIAIDLSLFFQQNTHCYLPHATSAYSHFNEQNATHNLLIPELINNIPVGLPQ